MNEIKETPTRHPPTHPSIQLRRTPTRLTKIEPHSLQRRARVQRDMLRSARERFFKVGQVLAVIDAAISYNVDGEHAVFEGLEELGDYEGLIDLGAHGEGVVAWVEG